MPKTKRPRRPRNPLGEFHAHEALDRLHLFAHLFQDFVVDHAFIESQPRLKRKAERIADALGDLYQLVGQVRFAEERTPGEELPRKAGRR